MKQIILKKYHVTYFTIQAFEKAFKTSTRTFWPEGGHSIKDIKGTITSLPR